LPSAISGTPNQLRTPLEELLLRRLAVTVLAIVMSGRYLGSPVTAIVPETP